MKPSKTTESESLQAENEMLSGLVSEIVELVGNSQSFLDEAAAIYKQKELSTAERVRVAKIQVEILRVILNCAKILRKSAHELATEEMEIEDYVDEISELMNQLMDEIEAIVLFAQIENMTPLLPKKVMTYQTAEC